MFTLNFILTFIIAFVLLLLLIKYSHLIKMHDIPNERSSHKRITPISGGIAIFSSFIIVQLFLHFGHIVEHNYVYASISLVFLLGLVDDIYDVSPKIKFIGIFLATLFLYFNGFEITTLGVFYGVDLLLPTWIILPFTFFAIAGFTNSINLMDGLDGLASLVSLVILVGFLSIGIVYHDTLMIALSSSLAASILAFLLFNWHPAKIFMGDSGSLTIGFIISILTILSLQYMSIVTAVFFIGLPILDTFIIIYRRVRRGISPFVADKNHMHHLLLKVKDDVPFVSVFLATVQGVFSIIGFQLINSNNFITLLLFILFFFVFLYLFDPRFKRRKKEDKYSVV